MELLFNMNENFRIPLWNAFLSKVFSKITLTREGMVGQDFHLFISLWKYFFKLPLDEYERDVNERKAWYRDQFESLETGRLFELIEFCYFKLTHNDATDFMREINLAFECSNSPLRLCSGKVIPLDSSLAARQIDSVSAFSDLDKHLHDVHLALSSLVECFVAAKKEEKTLPSLQDLFCAVRDLASTLKEHGYPKECAEVIQSIERMRDVSGDAEFEFALNCCVAAIRYLIRRGCDAGLFSASDSGVKYQLSDPWGERRF